MLVVQFPSRKCNQVSNWVYVKELHFYCSCDVSPGDEETVIDCSILNVILLKYEQHTPVKISLTSVVISLFFVLIVAYYKFN